MADTSEPTSVPESSNNDTKQVTLPQLRQALVAMFNESEMRALYFDLGVNYDAAGGRGTTEKAIELIENFQRRQRLNVLLAAMREQRPHISWEKVVVSKGDVEPAPMPPSLKLPPADINNTLIISQSFTALIRLMRSPAVRAAVIAFQTDFQAASEQIDLMNDYKRVHDLFQELENRYALIYNDQKRLPADETAWENIELNEPELRSKTADLITAVRQATFDAEEARWIRQLDQAKDEIRLGIEEFDLDKLKSGARTLSRILNRQPTRINAQLVATARAIRLDALEDAMTTISNNLSQADFGLEAVNQIQDSVGALAGLDGRLNSLVRQHNAWQELDDELRRVEAGMGQDIEELEDAWYDLKPMAHDLYAGQAEDWAAALQKVTKELDKALADRVIVTVRRLFRRFHSQVGHRFRRVNLELLSLCQDLQKVGEPLDLLLRNFR